MIRRNYIYKQKNINDGTYIHYKNVIRDMSSVIIILCIHVLFDNVRLFECKYKIKMKKSD